MTPHPWPFTNKGSRRVNNWISSFDLYSVWRTMPWQHERDIYHGYRSGSVNWWYCVKSMATPNNDVVNIWSHLIPAAFIGLMFWEFFKYDLRGVWKGELFLFPWYYFALGVMALLLGSAAGHTFRCMNSGIREVCICAEYIGLSLHALGASVAFTMYLCPYSCIMNQPGIFIAFYSAVLGASVASLAMVCQARMPRKRERHKFRIQPFLTHLAVLCAPCALKYLWMDEPERIPYAVRLNSGNVCSVSIANQMDFVWIAGSWIVAGAIEFYRYPEKLKPGKFDIIGNSHNLYHICTASAVYYETQLIHTALKEVMRLNRVGSLTRHDLGVNRWTTLYMPGAALLTIGTVGFQFCTDLRRKFNKNVITRQLEFD